MGYLKPYFVGISAKNGDSTSQVRGRLDILSEQVGVHSE
jgi:hypothetical protein